MPTTAPSKVPLRGLIMHRNRHVPRLCPTCDAPLGAQEDACWSCGLPLTGDAVAPPWIPPDNADRWADDGGAPTGRGIAAAPASHVAGAAPGAARSAWWAGGEDAPTRPAITHVAPRRPQEDDRARDRP